MVEDNLKKYKVLLTGFEPFGKPKPEFNPSWETVKSLNGSTLFEGNNEFEVECLRLPVEYEKIQEIIPKLHSKNQYDYIIHVGQGYPDRLAIESKASSYGYEKKDNEDYVPGSCCVPDKYIQEEKEYTLDTVFDSEKLANYLKEKGFKLCCSSCDAGRYLCEYTLFCSLAEAKLNKTKETKALFVHVPTPPLPYEYDTLIKVTKEIVCQLPNFEK